MKGVILDIQRMSTEDGPGLRTTVFFKGCTLTCDWCHNPESIVFSPIPLWQKERCIGCGNCVKACPAGAICAKTEGISIDRKPCRHCFSCVEACPTAAMIKKGREYEAETLFKELVKDRAYFNEAGGVTLSGGEALAQGQFALELLRLLKQAGINTALDTAGNVPYAVFKSALAYTDILLYDIKLINPAEHKEHTRADNSVILANLLAAKKDGILPRLWIRTPIIPGATDNAENIAGIARFIKDNLAGAVERWELCAFNNLCKSKYTALNETWKYNDAPLMLKEDMERLVLIAERELSEKGIARRTGSAR